MTKWKQNLSILANYPTWIKDTLPLLSEEPLRFCTAGWVTITELWLNYFWIVLLEGPYQVFIQYITVYLSSLGHFFRPRGFDFILKFTDTHETLYRLVCFFPIQVCLIEFPADGLQQDEELSHDNQEKLNWTPELKFKGQSEGPKYSYQWNIFLFARFILIDVKFCLSLTWEINRQ